MPSIEEVDNAILKALVRAGEALRCNELHKRADFFFGQRIWDKTFHVHLKKLCRRNLLRRREISRYNVTYELTENAPKEMLKDTRARLLKQLEWVMELPGGQEFFEGVIEDVTVRLENLGVMKRKSHK